MATTPTPVFAQTPAVGPVAITAALTKSDGTATGIATDIFKAFTTGSNGSYVQGVRVSQGATAAGTSTTATLLRVYLSTKTSGATTGGTDTWLLAEQMLPSQSADSASAPTATYFVPIGMVVPTGYTILVSTHHAPAANTVVSAIVVAEDY